MSFGLMQFEHSVYVSMCVLMTVAVTVTVAVECVKEAVSASSLPGTAVKLDNAMFNLSFRVPQLTCRCCLVICV